MLSARVAAELRSDAERCYPLEGCGILIGAPSSARSSVRELRLEENVDPGKRRRRFTIAPEALLRAQKDARAAGLEVIGYYHSHPDAPAVPSPTDLAAAWPDVSHLIVPVENGVAGVPRSWRLDRGAGAFLEEKIEYEGG